MRRTYAVAALAAAVALSPTVAAEDPAASRPYTIVVPEQGMLATDLMMSVGAVSGLALTWDAKDKMVSTARLLTTGSLSFARDELLDALRALLWRFEIVLLPTGASRTFQAKGLRDLPSMVAERLQPETVDPSDASTERFGGKEGWFVTTVLGVRHLDVLEEARLAVVPFLSAHRIGSVTVVPDARAFVITDFAPNVARVVRTLVALDAKAATPSRQAAHLPLKRASAAAVVPVLRELFPDSTPDPAIVPAPRGLRIAADSAANQVVVLGTPGQIRDVTAALEGLDREPATKPADAAKPK
jgi:hypothetical protein